MAREAGVDELVCLTFGARQMRDKLPKGVAKSLFASIRQGKKLDIEVAPVAAMTAISERFIVNPGPPTPADPGPRVAR